jgi:hypothetical protein
MGFGTHDQVPREAQWQTSCGHFGHLAHCSRVTGYAEVIPVNPTAPLLPAWRQYVQNRTGGWHQPHVEWWSSPMGGIRLHPMVVGLEYTLGPMVRPTRAPAQHAALFAQVA